MLTLNGGASRIAVDDLCQFTVNGVSKDGLVTLRHNEPSR